MFVCLFFNYHSAGVLFLSLLFAGGGWERCSTGENCRFLYILKPKENIISNFGLTNKQIKLFKDWVAAVKWIIWCVDQRRRVVFISVRQRWSDWVDVVVVVVVVLLFLPSRNKQAFLKNQSLARYHTAVSSRESRTKLFFWHLFLAKVAMCACAKVRGPTAPESRAFGLRKSVKRSQDKNKKEEKFTRKKKNPNYPTPRHWLASWGPKAGHGNWPWVGA